MSMQPRRYLTKPPRKCKALSLILHRKGAVVTLPLLLLLFVVALFLPGNTSAAPLCVWRWDPPLLTANMLPLQGYRFVTPGGLVDIPLSSLATPAAPSYIMVCVAGSYFVKAYNTLGMESLPSNTVTLEPPPPPRNLRGVTQ